MHEKVRQVGYYQEFIDSIFSPDLIFVSVNYACINPDVIEQCFSTAGPRPGTGPWHQLYRAARGLRKLQYAARFH